MDNCLNNLKVSGYGLRMNDTVIKSFLYADDQVLITSSAEELQRMITVMNDAFEWRGMKVDVN